MKILIDNGHGIKTKGKRSPDGRLLEYAQNRLLAGRIVTAPKTAEKYITTWCKGGQLVRIAQGKYEKA